jgi:hypothetical protein
MREIPIPITELIARTESLAQDLWEKANSAPDTAEARKQAFLTAVRIAYVTGVQLTIDAVKEKQKQVENDRKNR